MRPRVTQGTQTHILTLQLRFNMANFSVEWLSKSYYEEITVPAKSAALHSKVHSENEEFTKDSRSQYSPTSPNSKCVDKLCLKSGDRQLFV